MHANASYSHRFFTETLSRVRGDAAIYMLIALYAALGLLFLAANGAGDRASYLIYVKGWALMFGMIMPAVALLFDFCMIIHRFDRRRTKVFQTVFSPARMAYFASSMMIIAAMMFFQGTFTSVKNAMFVWQGAFHFDVAMADFDKSLHFGVDPWRYLYAWFAEDWIRKAVELNYNVFWHVLCFSIMFFMVTSPRVAAHRFRYLICMWLTWIIVGNVLAGLFMSAGPAFYGHVTGDSARFGPQLEFLGRSMQDFSSASNYQHILWSLHEAGRTGFASGISAFPSVHVAFITLNALFVWEYSRRLGALLFAYVGFVIASSVYLAWHYAIDGYFAVPVTFCIYALAKRYIPAGARFRAGAAAVSEVPQPHAPVLAPR